MAFPDAVFEALRREPDSVVVEHGSRRVTRAELLSMTRRIAAGLRKGGRGIAMITEVTPEALAAYLAAFALGCRVVGVRPGYSDSQMKHVLSNGVDTVVTDETITELLDSADEPLILTSRPDDVARLVYTSGSTGRPKGCAQTYKAMSAHWSWGEWDADTEKLAGCTDRYLLFGSLASVVVQDYLALCLLHGGTAVIPVPDGKPLFPDVIERLRITFTIMNVPRLYDMLDALREREVDTSSLRGMLVAGSPLAPHRLAEATQRLGPVVFQGYGQSETGGLTLLTPDDIAAGELASVGRAHPRVEIEIRDGEIWVRNEYLMSEYWGDPEETAEVLVDGWLRTRDLGELKNGYLHLTGRARDVIIVNGYPVYAGPIERVLAAHPDVDQAYVLGTPDEVVRAFVIPVDGRTPDRAELSTVVEQELGPGSVPAAITFISEVPLGPSGKPDKKALMST
jgi:acyl-CoA synthetase (AMP-forming)/AMP-acid ligase II